MARRRAALPQPTRTRRVRSMRSTAAIGAVVIALAAAGVWRRQRESADSSFDRAHRRNVDRFHRCARSRGPASPPHELSAVRLRALAQRRYRSMRSDRRAGQLSPHCAMPQRSVARAAFGSSRSLDSLTIASVVARSVLHASHRDDHRYRTRVAPMRTGTQNHARSGPRAGARPTTSAWELTSSSSSGR